MTYNLAENLLLSDKNDFFRINFDNFANFLLNSAFSIHFTEFAEYLITYEICIYM
jgi:hypothetical protein